MPKISIVTPSFNSAGYIKNTYQSVRTQSYTDWEWIVVDDCSSDNTFELVQSISSKDPRVKAFRNKTNSGASVSRNKGLDEAQGEYIAFLDADDLWCEKKLQTQINFMESQPFDFTYHDYNMINMAGTFLKSMQSPEIIDKTLLESHNPIFTSSVMVRKSALGNIRFKTLLRRRQDYIFWYDLIKVMKTAKNIGEVLGSYTVGNIDSLSSNKLKNISIQWHIYRKEFNLSVPQSIKSIVGYALHGIRKYFL
jgi:teichuronic acid biosynthesis glycosyltransferase TuaG